MKQLWTGIIGFCVMAALGFGAVQIDSSAQADTPVNALTASAHSTDVMRARDGHFRAHAQVNGHSVTMMVDTGASIVLLTDADARAAGIDPSQLSFTMPVLTANGRGYIAGVTLDRVVIGDIRLDNVRAAVAAPGQLHASLLGMSFLGEIDEAVIRRDRLILRN